MSLYKTPLRYPGGKQRVWRFIDEILSMNDLVGGHYVEPYAGGAGVAIELLLRDRVVQVHLNDSCEAVTAFWSSILQEPERFCRKISRASLTVEEWKKQKDVFKSRSIADRFDLGFAFFYLNRCNRSGILTGGVIGGLDQGGDWKMDARFPRNELITRVEAIASKKSKIKVRNLDAEVFITEYISKLPKKTFVYCDPPYYRKAQRLYPNAYLPEDHARIAKVIQNQINLPWAASYDSCPEIQAHYAKRRTLVYRLQYNAARAYQGTELFIFSERIKIPSCSAIPSIHASLATISFHSVDGP